MSQNAIDWVQRPYAQGSQRRARVLMALPAAAGARSADTTCPLSLTRLDATPTNVLAVDTNAVYWGGSYAALQGTRIRIEGQYPHARYSGRPHRRGTPRRPRCRAGCSTGAPHLSAHAPDPSFAGAIQNVAEPGAERAAMEGYYPQGEYLAGPGEFRAPGCSRG